MPDLQPFPESGKLADNLSISLCTLKAKLRSATDELRSYVIRTVKWDRTTKQFAQKGSAPNFQGDCITLCTCKHQMRCSLECSEWRGIWIAGFTSRSTYEERHWLFFLTRVEEAYQSHADLWRSLSPSIRAAKSAQENYLGDLFKPRGRVTGENRFDPGCYHLPYRHVHRQDSCDNHWQDDIRYERFGRRPSLLVGDPKLTFIWQDPIIFFGGDHCRDFKKWDNISAFLGHLKGA
jgi:hypothetical protein